MHVQYTLLLMAVGVCYNRTLMMLSQLALGPIILSGLSFRRYGFFCLVHVEFHAPSGIACLWMLLLMDQVPVFLPMEPRLAPYGRPL